MWFEFMRVITVNPKCDFGLTYDLCPNGDLGRIEQLTLFYSWCSFNFGFENVWKNICFGTFETKLENKILNHFSKSDVAV